jgi:GntR family transcriptional regulator
LTRDFGVPLYQQIQHLIRHRISKGEYTPGSQIPSESELCRELSVSRVTLREALRDLVRDDMLVKIQGRHLRRQRSAARAVDGQIRRFPRRAQERVRN